MKRKTPLNIKKRVLAGIAISALALAVVGGVNFSAIADAAKGVLDNAAEYGEQLGDQTPESLFGSEYAGWDWVDDKTKTYFGKPGDQKFVVRNAATDEAATAYKEVTVPVQRRKIAPVVKQGTISGTPASFVTAERANISTYERTVTITAGENGTVSINGGMPSQSVSGTYVIGQTITIRAEANEGYKFAEWSDDSTAPAEREIVIKADTNGNQYIATFEAQNVMAVTSSLPANPGDISIMTISEAYVALGGNLNSGDTVGDPTYGYYTSTYYMYAVNDKKGTDDAISKSTSANLQSVGIDWYNQLNKPTADNERWTVGNHTLFGGPLHSILHGSTDPVKNYRFYWNYSPAFVDPSSSNSQNYWGYIVSSDVYVAVIKANTQTNNTMAVTTSLPAKSGDVSIMTLEQAYVALGGSTDENGYGNDPAEGYDTSAYYMYSINNTAGTNDAIDNSTDTNLQAVGLNWYKQLKKPSQASQHFDVVDGVNGSYKVFGGPLKRIEHNDSNYSFCWYYSVDSSSSNEGNYWNDFVPNSAYVAVVRSNNNIMQITDKLPVNKGDVSIMTLNQLYTIIGTYRFPYFSCNNATYYVYAICDAPGTNSGPASAPSTAENLQAVGLEWYKQLNKANSSYTSDYWKKAGGGTHDLFGGPLKAIDKWKDTCKFEWFTLDGSYGMSGDRYHYYDYVPSNRYVAVVRGEHI